MARVVFVGNFALGRKATMDSRSLPMARELRRAGHDASLLVPPWDALEQSGRLERRWGVPVHNVVVRRPLDPATLVALLRAVVAARPDVVVCVKPKAYAGLLALLLAPTRIRVVVDTDDWEAGWSALAGNPRPVRAFVALHESLALRVADHVIAASRELERRVRSIRADVTYLPNATWPGQAGWPPGIGDRVRATLGLGAGPLLLLYSRLFEFDQARFRSVVDRIVAVHPDARLLVVGADVRVHDRATTVGFVPRERIPDLLAAASLALVPFDDTPVNRARCSVKLLDLMLAGRPIVADSVGQNCIYLRDRQNGRLVTPGATAPMAEAALEVLGAPEHARALGQAAERDARDVFTWERQHASLLRAVLTAERGPTYLREP